MSEIFGSYSPVAPAAELLALTMHPDSFPVRWGLCSLTADFAAEYFVELLGASGAESKQSAEARSTISYVVNELIENAVKFNLKGDIAIRFGLDQKEVLCEVVNQVSGDMAPALREKLNELSTGDPSELMLLQVEANAEANDSKGSGLGFLLIMNDYGTSLGWKLEALPRNKFRIHTTARIPVSAQR